MTDSPVLVALLPGEEIWVYGDLAYRGQETVIRYHAPRAQDVTNGRYLYGE